MGGHDLRHRDAKSVFFFRVEEGIAVEVDHAVCYATVAEALGDEFCYADYDLREVSICICRWLGGEVN